MKNHLLYCVYSALTLMGASCGYLTDDAIHDDVGACGDYQALEGICTGTGENTFSFEGVINGESVVNTGNTLYESETLAEGESVPCGFLWATAGSCTPCLFDIGECGQEAWDDIRAFAFD